VINSCTTWTNNLVSRPHPVGTTLPPCGRSDTGISPLSRSLYSYRLAICYLRKVKFESVIPPSFLCVLRDCGMWLVFGVSSCYRLRFGPVWALSGRERLHPRLFAWAKQAPGHVGKANLVWYFGEFKFIFRSYFGHTQASAHRRSLCVGELTQGKWSTVWGQRHPVGWVTLFLIYCIESNYLCIFGFTLWCTTYLLYSFL